MCIFDLDVSPLFMVSRFSHRLPSFFLFVPLFYFQFEGDKEEDGDDDGEIPEGFDPSQLARMTVDHDAVCTCPLYLFITYAYVKGAIYIYVCVWKILKQWRSQYLSCLAFSCASGSSFFLDIHPPTSSLIPMATPIPWSLLAKARRDKLSSAEVRASTPSVLSPSPFQLYCNNPLSLSFAHKVLYSLIYFCLFDAAFSHILLPPLLSLSLSISLSLSLSLSLCLLYIQTRSLITDWQGWRDSTPLSPAFKKGSSGRSFLNRTASHDIPVWCVWHEG